MNNILGKITVWAKDLPYWEQATLDKLIKKKSLSDEDYQELIKYFLEDAGLVTVDIDKRIDLFQDNISNQPSPKSKVVLKEISNIDNVNALVQTSRLPFNNQLTAIFGRNGTGKSGYARILGDAGFTRGDKAVLPNINNPIAEHQVSKATIKFETNGEEKEIVYKSGNTYPELSSVYVFDSTSVAVHMEGKNEFSFSPAGLSLLTYLAQATDEVRNRLQIIIEEKQKPKDFKVYFSGNSNVLNILDSINAKTDTQELEKLAKITKKDEERIHQLNIEIANIGLGKHKEKISSKKEHKKNLEPFLKWLKRAETQLNTELVNEINREIKVLLDLQEQIKVLGAEQFKNKHFTQTGTSNWHNFIEAASQLAKAEGKLDYPDDGDVCLLCQQPLDHNASELIRHLWGYLSNEIETNIKNQEAKIENFIRLLESDDFSLHTNHSESIKTIALYDGIIANKSTQVTKSYLQTGSIIKKATEEKTLISTSPNFPHKISQDINNLIQQLGIEILNLENQDIETKSKRLEEELSEIEHRKKLQKLLPEIENHIEDLKWSEIASKKAGSTRHITKRYNDLFEELVKKEYIKIFTSILERLGRPIHVEISTSGKKGNTVKQIQIKSHETAKSIASPNKILSEGEKRAIALADFLTEAKLDIYSNCLVLDDPVTSLDLEWRKEIAMMLSEEAKERQVIIFTHDMPFLYYLLQNADKLKLEKNVHGIKRGELDDLPGYVWIDNCPPLEQQYKSSQPARKLYEEAKSQIGKTQEVFLREGIAALRTSYEALVVFELFGGVVLRFEERISIGRLTGLVWDDAIVTQINDNYGRLSRYIEGHLHSDTMAKPVTLELLDNEIKTFDSIKKSIRDLKKQKEKVA